MNDNQNICDKCKCVELSEYLVWINSEDFEPRQNEIVPIKVHNNYEALCDACYLDVITIC